MKDKSIEAYRELLEAAQEALSVPLLMANGGSLSKTELQRRQQRLKAAAKGLAQECDLELSEDAPPKQTSLHLV